MRNSKQLSCMSCYLQADCDVATGMQPQEHDQQVKSAGVHNGMQVRNEPWLQQHSSSVHHCKNLMKNNIAEVPVKYSLLFARDYGVIS